MSVDVDNTIIVTGSAPAVARWKAAVVTPPEGQVWDRIAILDDEPEKLVVDWTSNYSLQKSALQIDEYPELDFEIASIIGDYEATYFLVQCSGGKVTRHDFYPSYDEGGDIVLELRDFRGERERLLQKFGEGAFKKLNGDLAEASKGKSLGKEEDGELVHPEDDEERRADIIFRDDDSPPVAEIDEGYVYEVCEEGWSFQPRCREAGSEIHVGVYPTVEKTLDELKSWCEMCYEDITSLPVVPCPNPCRYLKSCGVVSHD